MHETSIDIRGVDKAALLVALFNASKVDADTPEAVLEGSGDAPMELKEACEMIDRAQAGGNVRLAFDYHRGRPLKVVIGGSSLRTTEYNAQLGIGAAEAVVAALARDETPGHDADAAETAARGPGREEPL